MDAIAVDWSGRVAGSERTIWLAQARHGALLRLENGRGRAELVRHLIDTKDRHARLAVGLDFNFSFPIWFLQAHGLESVRQLWALADTEGEEWLRRCEPPFWGRPGRKRPNLPSHFRVTERPGTGKLPIQPKSVFQIGGAGAVGTGSIRGMPYLAQLQRAGFSVWPFDPPGWPRLMEVYPRIMTGPVVKSDRRARIAYLDSTDWKIDRRLVDLAVSSEDAFDAAISAMVMSEHESDIERLEPTADPVTRLEGAIWRPGPQ